MHSSAILHGHRWELRSLTSTTKRPATSGSLKLNELGVSTIRVSEWDQGIRIITSGFLNPSANADGTDLGIKVLCSRPRAIPQQEESELPDAASPRDHNPRHPQPALSSKDEQIAFSPRPNSGPSLAELIAARQAGTRRRYLLC